MGDISLILLSCEVFYYLFYFLKDANNYYSKAIKLLKANNDFL